ncbi:calreticulin-like isoform X2 [Camellia sinensis]|uniref:calreticulin-like isoform X2 n=1 Tax=Camellia sinensis TaxID=4442 RepID=UPI00103629B0|nr:calreticulin-like isoform X2 [Camellia sinensis]
MVGIAKKRPKKLDGESTRSSLWSATTTCSGERGSNKWRNCYGGGKRGSNEWDNCYRGGAPGCINDSLLTGLQFVEGFERFFFVKRWTMHQLKIKNPNYQRKWKTPMIDNPEFKDDPEIYVFPKLKYVGIDLWQVKSRTLFDNVLICDDPDYAMKLAEATWGKQKDESKDDPVDSDAEGDDDETDKDADITEESAHDEL